MKTLSQSPQTAAKLLMLVIALLSVVALLWAIFARLEISVYGVGNVIPSGQLQIVQNLEGGIVSEILVSEGDIVSKDQIVMRVDPTDFSAKLEDTRGSYAAALLRSARLSAELDDSEFASSLSAAVDFPELAAKERELFEARKRNQEAVLRAFDTRIDQKRLAIQEMQSKFEFEQQEQALLEKEYALNQPLAERKIISEGEFLRIEQARLAAEKAMTLSQLAIAKLKAEWHEAEAGKNEAQTQIKAEILAELNSNDVLLASLAQELKSHSDKVFRRDVRSPVNGIVNRVLINTVGGVIQSGDDLVEIVPLRDELQIRLLVSPRDIGFLHPQQTAIVRFTAYDASLYGSLPGQVTRIGADAVSDADGNRLYEVLVRTERHYLGSTEGQLPIIPGMQAEVHIVTGDRSIMDYLVRPIDVVRSRALRER